MPNMDLQDTAMLVPFFPERIQTLLKHTFVAFAGVEEIRVRAERPIQIIGRRGERILRDDIGRTVIITRRECAEMLNAFCSYSIYANEDELRRGFITLSGGYRVGLCGKALTENGSFFRFSIINAFNIRIMRPCTGCADAIMPMLIDSRSHVVNTLVISAPAVGKTTLLRDITRQLANMHTTPPIKVCLIDERSEIAGCRDGIPTNDIGIRCDVIDGCPKLEAMSVAVRVMSPSVIVMDELGSFSEAEAALDACNCGISIIASAHAANINEALSRPALSTLINSRRIAQVVCLSTADGKRSYDIIKCNDLWG